MEIGNMKDGLPLVLIVLLSFIVNLYKKRKKRETPKQPPPISPSPPNRPVLHLSSSNNAKVLSTSDREKREVILSKCTSTKREPHIRKPRIQSIVNRLHSKKDIIYLSTLLFRKDDF